MIGFRPESSDGLRERLREIDRPDLLVQEK